MKPEMDYSIRQYQPGDEDGIVELLELVFDGWPHFDLECTPIDHWRWKFLEEPFRSDVVTIGVSGNRIIGCDHGKYTRIIIGEKELLCQQTVDSAVHPDFRGMGVFTKMNELKHELRLKRDVKINYFVSGNPILQKSRRFRSMTLFPLPVVHLIRIRDVDLHSRVQKWSPIKKLGALLYIKTNTFGNVFEPTQKTRSEIVIEETVRFDDRIDEFWDQTKGHYSLIVERSSEYLNWRFCDPRGGNYVIRQAQEDGRIIGYCVLRINRFRTEYPTGHVVDLLTLPYRLDVAEVLIEDAFQYFNDQSINVVYYWVIEGHPYEKLFKRYDFVDSRSKYDIGLRPIDVGSEWEEMKNAPPSKFHFQLGDTDHV